MSILLLGYDSEGIKEDFPSEKVGLKAIAKIHQKHNVSGTLFILGRAFLSDVKFYKEIFSEFPFDIQQHTYSHIMLNNLDVPSYGGNRAPIEMIREELPFMQDILKKYLGIKANGLRAPVSYLTGLQGETEVLEAIRSSGIDFVSSDASDSWSQFLTGEKKSAQPYWYPTGTLEIPMHSLHDGVWKDRYGYDQLERMTDYYQKELTRFGGNIYAPVFHPWILANGDPEGVVLDDLIQHAKEKSFKIMSYHQMWESFLS